MGASTDNLRRITIFLASPSDTAREFVERVVAAVGEEPAFYNKARLEIQQWDDRSKPVPMAFLQCPQEQVETYKTSPAFCNLVIGLLRHRLGTPLKDEGKYGISPVTEKTRTGTEWELHQATQNKIDTWVFRDVSFFEQNPSASREERKARSHQYDSVCDYFEIIGNPSHTHVGADELEEILLPLLRTWLTEYLQAHEHPSTSVAVKGQTPNTDPRKTTQLTHLESSIKQTLLTNKSPELDDIIALYRDSPVPNNINTWLLHRWAGWARRVEGVITDAGELHRQFVTLQMMLDRSRLPNAPPVAQLEGERWLDAQKYNSLSAALNANRDKSGWVLVGPPGSGKSTALQHHEMQCCVNAMRDESENPEVCLWFRLSGYNDDSPLPAQWLSENWREQNPAMPSLDAMQARF